MKDVNHYSVIKKMYLSIKISNSNIFLKILTREIVITNILFVKSIKSIIRRYSIIIDFVLSMSHLTRKFYIVDNMFNC